MKLNKSLYGTKQAPRTWFLKLKECLEHRGFRQSELDPCFFIHADMVYLNYVDDSILIGRDKSLIDAMITNLSLELELTREGDLASFLGIQIDRSSLTGSLKLTQLGLITRILETTGLVHGSSSPTPATREPLGTDSTKLAQTLPSLCTSVLDFHTVCVPHMKWLLRKFAVICVVL